MKVADLKKVLKGSHNNKANLCSNEKITGIEFASGKVVQGNVFVCLVGRKQNGHDHVEEAIKNGAIAIVCQNQTPPTNNENVAVFVVESTRKALATICAEFWDNPSKKLKMIGVTGTNGKTTTAFAVRHILEKEGVKTGVIGTEGSFVGSECIAKSLTSPDPFELHFVLAKMVEKGCVACVMEVSAHAIFLEKIHGINFEVGCLLNITHDHLDFFETMEKYASTKTDKFMKSGAVSSVVTCETQSKNFAKATVFGESENCSHQISQIEETEHGILFCLKNKGETFKVCCPVFGSFFASNITAAIAIVEKLGVKTKKAVLLVSSFQGVEGRMQQIQLSKNSVAVIDFAHTPDALEKALQAVTKIFPKPIVTIFGCAGNHDAKKRPIMGAIAEKMSGFVILTADNPEFENVLSICKEIESGMKKKNHITIQNRVFAIEMGVEYVQMGGTLLICGKGAETCQIVKGEQLPHNDAAVVGEILRKKEVNHV